MSSEITRYVRAYALTKQAPRRVARTLLALCFALASVVSTLMILRVCMFDTLRAGWTESGFVAALAALAAAAWWAVQRREQRMRRRELEQAAEQRVMAAGYAQGSGEQGAVEVRAAFWHHTQRDALESLRIRLASRDQSRDMLEALSRPVRENKTFVRRLSGLWALLTLIISGFMAAKSGDAVAALASCWLISAILFSMPTLYVLSLAGLGGFVKELAEQRELRRETHRVVSLIDTAGGLSLAEGEVRDILAGAIEPAGVVGGELEVVCDG